MLWKSGPVRKPRWSVPANPIKGHRKLTRHRQETRERLDMRRPPPPPHADYPGRHFRFY